MKQTSRKQVEALAIKKYGIGSFMATALQEWVAKNSYAISMAIDGKNKTLFGEFPKGWKAEMMAAAEKSAKDAAVEYFIRENGGRVLDGAIWINR